MAITHGNCAIQVSMVTQNANDTIVRFAGTTPLLVYDPNVTGAIEVPLALVSRLGFKTVVPGTTFLMPPVRVSPQSNGSNLAYRSWIRIDHIHDDQRDRYLLFGPYVVGNHEALALALGHYLKTEPKDLVLIGGGESEMTNTNGHYNLGLITRLNMRSGFLFGNGILEPQKREPYRQEITHSLSDLRNDFPELWAPNAQQLENTYDQHLWPSLNTEGGVGLRHGTIDEVFTALSGIGTLYFDQNDRILLGTNLDEIRSFLVETPGSIFKVDGQSKSEPVWPYIRQLPHLLNNDGIILQDHDTFVRLLNVLDKRNLTAAQYERLFRFGVEALDAYAYQKAAVRKGRGVLIIKLNDQPAIAP